MAPNTHKRPDTVLLPSNTQAFEALIQSSQSSSGDTWWIIDEIIAEKATRYKVIWAGYDPQTGEPWEPSWVRAAGKLKSTLN